MCTVTEVITITATVGNHKMHLSKANLPHISYLEVQILKNPKKSSNKKWHSSSKRNSDLSYLGATNSRKKNLTLWLRPTIDPLQNSHHTSQKAKKNKDQIPNIPKTMDQSSAATTNINTKIQKKIRAKPAINNPRDDKKYRVSLANMLMGSKIKWSRRKSKGKRLLLQIWRRKLWRSSLMICSEVVKNQRVIHTL